MAGTSLPVRVACCQIKPRFGDVDWNRSMLRRAIRGAADQGGQLIVLPELCTTGYGFESRNEARALAHAADGGVLDDWVEEAGRSGAVIIGGFAEIGPGGELFNSAAIVDASGVLGIYRKTHLWDSERAIFRAGSEPAPVINTALGRVGMSVCYDLFFPEVTRGLALGGADIVAVPTNSPRSLGAVEPRDNIGVSIARAAAHVNRIFIAVCDRSGDERGLQWAGRSTIVDPEGDLVAEPPGDVETTLLADCDLAIARDKRWARTTNDALGDRRPDVYQLDFPAVGSPRADGIGQHEPTEVG